MSCCNCTKQGHDSTTCTKYRWSQHFVTPRYVTSYAKGPDYEAGATTAIAEINPVLLNPLHKHQDALLTPVDNLRKSNTIFHYSTLPKRMIYLTKIIYPHDMDVSFKYDKTGRHTGPQFLKTQFNNTTSCQIEVQIVRIPRNQVEIFLRAVDQISLDLLEKLMLQWLVRSTKEREIMKKGCSLPFNKRRLLKILSNKMNEFLRHTHKSAWKHLKTLKSLEQLVDNIKPCVNKKKTAPEIAEVEKEFIKRTYAIDKLTLKLLASLYNYGLIPTAKETLDEFINLIDRLKDRSNSTTASPDEYMAAMWFNLELFTPHLSAYIVAAAKVWERSELKRKKTTTTRITRTTATTLTTDCVDEQLIFDPIIPKSRYFDPEYEAVGNNDDVQMNEDICINENSSECVEVRDNQSTDVSASATKYNDQTGGKILAKQQNKPIQRAAKKKKPKNQHPTRFKPRKNKKNNKKNKGQVTVSGKKMPRVGGKKK